MADLLALSTRIIDSGFVDQPVNRVTNELSEVADGIAVVESFSHSIAVHTDAGIACFDASGVHTGAAVIAAIEHWNPAPLSHLFYTHGHADHVGGSAAFATHAEQRGHRRPHVVGHDHVAQRLDRYDYTNDWSLIINARQFGGVPSQLNLSVGGDGVGRGERFLPTDTMRPDETFSTTHSITVGDEVIELRHARGETDDHLWAWLPQRRAVVTGDFLIWNFPNAGNPQKVQRYPLEWAAALREIAALDADLLLPAHGLPIEGSARIARVLGEVATALEVLVAEVVGLMNSGATLDTIVHTVKVPDDTLAKPYLRPLYDEPEFVVRNIWRLYGGWWDGAASRLKPSPDAQLATVLAELAGGVDALVRRAEQASADRDLRLASHLADLAGWAAPDDPGVHAARAAIYQFRRKVEPSLMAKGIFASAARESELVVEGGDQGHQSVER